MCVTEDSHRNIWVGTRHGLFRYNASDNSFTRFTVADGLPNDFVYGILEDELARLWISTNNGMACFDTRKNSFRRYTLRDGIANNQFNLYSYCRSRDGIFWFGGIGGITWFRPHDLVDNPFAPEPQITGVDVADADGDRCVRIERDSAGRVTAAAFPSVRNIFTVRFVAVNPLAGGCNTFAYKLEGFNTRWYETSHLEVNYSNLKPGHYVFKVRAANNDGRWNDEPATVEIRVLPMWWQTLAAKILWALLALGFVGGVVAALLGRMKMKMQLRLERMEKEAIGQLSQEKIRFYINLSHELRTPLTLILSPLQEIREHGTADKYVSSRLNYIYRNSLKLLHIINQLLDYRKAELEMFKMKVAVQDVDAIVAEVFSMFEEVAQNRDMDYILNSELHGEALPDDIEAYPAGKRAGEHDVRASIIRDAEKFLPEEWSGAGGDFAPAEEAPEQTRGTILLAESNAEVARYVADHFKAHYNVETVSDGNEVLERLKTLEPDIIIADRMLSGLDGLKLCQAVKQNIRTCHIPVVILAAEGSVEEQITGIEAGADSYLPMPLSISLLAANVQNLLKARYRMRHYYSDDAEIDPDKITSNSMDGEFLKKAIRIVEENMDNEEFSSNDFSKALCMSRSNLHLKMKSITGESATKFIRKIRFNHACKLLLDRKYSISEISSMVGFNSPSYFATSFKKHVGCLPTEYVRSRTKGGEKAE